MASPLLTLPFVARALLTLLMTLCASAWSSPDVSPTVLLLHGGDVGESHPSFVNLLATVKRHRLIHEVDPIDSNIRYREGVKGRYAAIVMSDYKAYAHLSRMLRERMHQYALDFGVGFYFLYVHHFDRMNDGQLNTGNHVDFTKLRLSPDTTMPRLLRNGGDLPGPFKGRYIRIQEQKGYEALAFANMGGITISPVVRDLGAFDGIKRVFFGPDFLFEDWFFDLLFLDCIQWLSPVELPLPLTKWIGVDVDDVFQPTSSDTSGVKMQATDVEALLDSQREISTRLGETFRYELGFNSNWFEKSISPTAAEEIEGDRAFVASKAEFHWFDHMPGHELATNHSLNSLETLMKKSKRWAEANGILPYINKYKVAPKHQGVYPIYEPLFQAWRNIWGVETTSTVRVATGFRHEGISVAPRVDLGLEWNAHSWSEIDKAKLEASLYGGYLFERIINNPVNLFMTHQANFARDRMAGYALRELIGFTQQWTRIKLVPFPSDELVKKYFELFPNLPPSPIESRLNISGCH